MTHPAGIAGRTEIFMQKLLDAFKKNTKEKLTAALFVILITVMFFGMLGNPFDFAEGFLTGYRNTVPPGTPIIDRLRGAITAAEEAVGEACFHRQDLVECYGLAMEVMGKKVVTDYNYGAVYKTKDEQITYSVQPRWVVGAANDLFPLVNSLKKEDIDFLYVQLPFKIAPDKYGGNDELPIYVTDYANANADDFLWQLNAAGVKNYDIRDEFWSSGYSQKELFFDTDHHWTIRGAFTATGLIANYLNENYDFGIPENLYTDENFKQTTYEKSFIGSMGRRVGKIYGGIDDFTVFTPAFPTDLTLTQIEGAGKQVFEGSFEDAVLEKKYLEDSDPTTNRYACYHGDYQELRFENHLAENDKKVLIIKDSFGIPIYSLLSLGVKEVRAIDMRLFEKNVAKYAAEYHPDLVIVMYNGDSFADPMFDFNPDAKE